MIDIEVAKRNLAHYESEASRHEADRVTCLQTAEFCRSQILEAQKVSLREKAIQYAGERYLSLRQEPDRYSNFREVGNGVAYEDSRSLIGTRSVWAVQVNP